MTQPLLRAQNLSRQFGGLLAVDNVSFDVFPGEVLTLIGPNGAGKCVLYPEDGEIADGTLSFDGHDLARMSAQQVVRAGLVEVPEGRRLFDTLSVEENLVAGSTAGGGAELRRALERVFELFPELAAHRRRTAGLLSGGQQQMVAIGRAMMAAPRMLMLDEPSLGLAPQVVEKILDTVARLRREAGLTVLLVEQNAQAALALADHGYILERGRVVLDGPSSRLMANDDVREFYLGMGHQGERRSMREVKHYRRRKRWLA